MRAPTRCTAPLRRRLLDRPRDDRHPQAYKPIDQIMADAAELVEIRHTLRQIINVKGD